MSRAGFLRAAAASKGALLVLDLDGTVCPIRKDRRKVRLSRRWDGLLKALAGSPGFQLAFLSGRDLRDLRRILPIKGAAWVGSHGNAWWRPELGPGPRRLAAWNGRARRLRRRLEADLEGLPSAAFEMKGPVFCLHLRGQSKPARARLSRRVRSRAASAAFRIKPGLEVLDLAPRGAWDKGDALRRLRQALGPSLPCLFAGDDRTDEAAFAALGRDPRCLSWKVGRGPSRAMARGSRDELHRFLRRIGRLPKGAPR
jgi:trehalose-phosphatase